jgi:hypothetical protein
MRDVRNFDRSEVLRIKGPSFLVRPCESGFVGSNYPFDELNFFREKESSVDRHLLKSLASDSADGGERRGMSGQGNEGAEGVWMLAPENTEVLRERRGDRPSFVSYLLISVRGLAGDSFEDSGLD